MATTGEEALTVGPLEANLLASKVVKVAKTGPSDCESMKSDKKEVGSSEATTSLTAVKASDAPLPTGQVKFATDG